MSEFVNVMITESLTTPYKVLTVGFRPNGNQLYIQKIDFLVSIHQGSIDGSIDLNVETRDDIKALLRIFTTSGG